MGGLGSGRQWSYKKRTVEDSKELTIDYFSRRGEIVPWGPYGILGWTNLITGTEFSFRYGFEVDSSDLTNSWLKLWQVPYKGEYLSYRIPLTYTQPNYGGVRWWFLCPIARDGIPCNRRVGRLYLPRGEKYFGCRQCHDLTYTSSQENHRDTILGQLAKKSGMTQREVIANLREFFFSQLEWDRLRRGSP